LATKSIHKKKNFNKKELAKKLDILAEKVSSKDIYVVGKEDIFYTVIDFKTKNIVFNDLPTRAIANKLCTRLNSKKLPKSFRKDIYLHLKDYHKLLTDTYFYKHTIINTTNEISMFTATSRLDLANARMKALVIKILSMC